MGVVASLESMLPSYLSTIFFVDVYCISPSQLGEIYERFYRDWSKALPYYEWCTREDPDRADAWFYIGM